VAWSDGAELADALWATIEKHIPKPKRQTIARDWVAIFEVRDCDAMLETAVGEAAGIKTTETRGSYFPWQD
jgi:hypothetical protein